MKKTPILHPFFFAIYAVLGVYAQRPQELPVEWILRPLIILLGVTFLTQLALRKWTGDNQRAGLITSLLLAGCFIGHIRNLLITTFSFTPFFLYDLLLLLVWSLILISLGSKKVWTLIKIPELVTNFLNVTSWVVILLPAYFVVVFAIQEIQQSGLIRKQAPTLTEVTLSRTTSKPDIYVIILDAYGRDDFLKDVFEYDNRDFSDFLRTRGFYIAEKSQSNYPQTQLSLSSLLNFQYPNEWTRGLEGTNNRTLLTLTIRHSEVRQVLEEIGYEMVNIPNSTLISDIEDSSLYLPMSKIRINQFEGLILSTTALDIFAQRWELGIPVPGYGTQRRTTQYQFDMLKEMPSLPRPKFIFVHILAPHPPFVFDRNGDPIQPNAPYTLGDGKGFPGTRAEYEEGYGEQITYINEQMKEVIDAILQSSIEPPIIILQSDHGPGSRFDMLALEDVECLWERYSILNAYYFPGQKYHGLYPSITPVNSFRVIFNTFFGTDLPMLEDKSYYASYGKPYLFEDLTGRIQSVCEIP